MGNFTVDVKSVAHSGGLGQPRSRTVNVNKQSRALMLPQEVKEITQDEELVFVRGCPPVKATKIRWYKEDIFTSRVQPAPDVPIAPLPLIEPIVYPDGVEKDPVVSPEDNASTDAEANNEDVSFDDAESMAMPALGPSFGVAPSGTWMWMSSFSWKSGSIPSAAALARTTLSAAWIDSFMLWALLRIQVRFENSTALRPRKEGRSAGFHKRKFQSS